MRRTFSHFLFTYIFFARRPHRPRDSARAESGCETGKVLSIKLNRTETPRGGYIRAHAHNIYKYIYITIGIYASVPIMETSIAGATAAGTAGTGTPDDEKTLGHEYNFPVRRTIVRNW